MNVVINTLIVCWTLFSIYVTINAATSPDVTASWAWAPGWMLFLAAVAGWAIMMVPVWVFLGLRAAARRTKGD
jgi:hypothetical protein